MCYFEEIMYIYEIENWPKFYWQQKAISELLIHVRHSQGRLIGGMEAIGFEFCTETLLQTLTQDVVKTSEIEGELLDQSQVRSSVAKRLGIENAALGSQDKYVDGVVEMMIDATQNFDKPLSKERLLKWHSKLFPNGQSGYSKIQVGAWRTGSVQVISGQSGREILHFEAPNSLRVDLEMELFLNWVHRNNKIDPVLKAAIAHLWFVTIHPFDDGNGRIGRAIADLLLARSEKTFHRFYSLSAQIQIERKNYYHILEKTQKGTLDVTEWVCWFLKCLSSAINKALIVLDSIMAKSKFWALVEKIPLNERQRKVINRLLDGFEGKLTTSKWAKIAKCSQDSAYRDILDLIDKKILIKNSAGGRSTSYSLNDQ